MVSREKESLVKLIFYPIITWAIRTFKFLELTFYKIFQKQVVSKIIEDFKDGDVVINGSRPWDIKVKNPDFFLRLACDATLGLGESYIDGWWECDALDEFSYRLFDRDLYQKLLHCVNRFFNYMLLRFFNMQTKARAFQPGEKHYDIGNEMFESFLDPSMTYSCGYWKNADNLHQAQLNKLSLIGEKLKLKPGMRVLDIGCGWGSLCKFLAETYNVSVVGCTVSIEGVKVGKELCKGLPVDLRVADYRDVDEKFDRIVSVGMFEHVGHDNYRTFFEICNKNLEEDGILLLHTMGVNHKRMPLVDPWFHTYIFPNGIFPYYRNIPDNIEDLFIIEDWHNFGHDYSLTLSAWYDNFVRNWPKISYKGERFYRMWTYYLKICEGFFRARRVQLWQVVLTKNGLKGGYESVR